MSVPGSLALGSLVSGSLVSGSPVSGSLVSGSLVSGSPVSGSPVSGPRPLFVAPRASCGSLSVSPSSGPGSAPLQKATLVPSVSPSSGPGSAPLQKATLVPAPLSLRKAPTVPPSSGPGSAPLQKVKLVPGHLSKRKALIAPSSRVSVVSAAADPMRSKRAYKDRKRVNNCAKQRGLFASIDEHLGPVEHVKQALALRPETTPPDVPPQVSAAAAAGGSLSIEAHQQLQAERIKRWREIAKMHPRHPDHPFSVGVIELMDAA